MIVIASALNHQLKEKKRKDRVWTRKDDEKNQMLCDWCFWFSVNALTCGAWRTGGYLDKKWVMVEEWKARGKSGRKKRKKKREKGKSGFGKSPFCFCLTVSLPLPFFPCTHHTTTPQHTLTHVHHTPYNMMRWCTPSHANRTMCCVAF